MKILIVDDEAPARDRLRQLLDDSGGHTVIGEAGNGRQALEMAQELRPDVVLLDIRMPGLDGIEVAHHFNAFDEPPAVVFTTAYDEYAMEAFDANAIGYVLKPVRRERLQKALGQAARISREKLGDVALKQGKVEPRGHVCTRRHGELKLIPVGDVHCFVADQKYVTVVHDDGEDLIEDSLKALEHEFADRFVRIHRSALVAIGCIEALTKNADGQLEIRLRNSDAGSRHELVVSRRHVADVRRRLKGK
jgi:two-component system, LytTR family, response regulator AlgR